MARKRRAGDYGFGRNGACPCGLVRFTAPDGGAIVNPLTVACQWIEPPQPISGCGACSSRSLSS